MIGGVASGIAEYFGIDPVLTRVAFVVLALSVGFGFLAYIVLWIIVPYDYEVYRRNDFAEKKAKESDFVENPVTDSSFAMNEKPSREKARNITAIILIIIGLMLLLDNLMIGFTFKNIGPILLILIGALILIFAKKNS